jgi:hypothetical protein
MNQEMTMGIWEPFHESSNEYGHMRAVNVSSNYYGHMSAVQWIKQWLLTHASRSMNQGVIKGTKVPLNESCNDYGHMREHQWIKQWLRAHGSRSMNQGVIKGSKVPFMNEEMTTSTWEPINVSSNDYGPVRAVQWIKQELREQKWLSWMKQWLRAHESRSMNQAMTTGIWEPFNESSNDYGHMRAVEWIKQWLRTHESRSWIKQ